MWEGERQMEREKQMTNRCQQYLKKQIKKKGECVNMLKMRDMPDHTHAHKSNLHSNTHMLSHAETHTHTNILNLNIIII